MQSFSKDTIRTALADWSWSAIAAGVVIALAVQILLLWLGNAIASSVGNGRPEGGFAIWTIIVQLGALFVGAAFASYLARVAGVVEGAALGAFTWALALVLGSAVASEPLQGWRPQHAGAAAWTTFLGALLSLATAMIGGALGSRRGRAQATTYEGTTATMAPVAR